MSEDGKFFLVLEQRKNYEFETRFDWDHLPPLLLDEPAPLGESKGPNASRLVGAAVGNCLSASLLFCLKKARQEVHGLKTEVAGIIQRNERGRLRIKKMDVNLVLDVDPEQAPRLERCLSLFEDFCVVTASIRKGIAIAVTVSDTHGKQLYFNDQDHD